MDLRVLYLLVPVDGLVYPGVATGETITISSVDGTLSTTAEVSLNGYVTGFRIIDGHTLVVDVPQEVLGEALTSVEVLVSTPIPGKSEVARLELSNHPQYISGTHQLIQQFVFQLFKSPGSDVFNPGDGVGFFDQFTQNTLSTGISAQEFAGEADRLIRAAAKQLRRKQMQYRHRLKRTERLVDVSIRNVNYDQQTGVARLVLVLVTEAGTAYNFGLEV